MTDGPKMAPSKHQIVLLGLAWNLWYQILATAIQFGTMMVCVRVISPAEYGRAAAVLGIIALLNTLNCSVIVGHALQLPEPDAPRWSLYWAVALRIQLAQALICNLMAVLAWRSSVFTAMAPLLHLASVGLLLDAPTQLRIVMLRRDLDFRRYRLVLGVGTLFSSLGTVALALAGGGAASIILGSNVLLGLPFLVDLLWIARWRPEGGWWAAPRWDALGNAIYFGVQRIGSGLLSSSRGALEAAVLPAVLGFEAMGLLNRALALYTSTVGRVGVMISETVYPLLPRSVGNPSQFRRHSTLFLLAVVLVGAPGAVFLGLDGSNLSRVLYGEKWISADPLLWPAALIGFGIALFSGGNYVLLAASRLRVCFLQSLLAALLTAPMVVFAWITGRVEPYAWAMATGQIIAGISAVLLASDHLTPGWIRIVILPSSVSTALGCAACLATRPLLAQQPHALQLALDAVLFGGVIATSLRLVFPQTLAAAIDRLPGGPAIRKWARLELTPSSL